MVETFLLQMEKVEAVNYFSWNIAGFKKLRYLNRKSGIQKFKILKAVAN